MSEQQMEEAFDMPEDDLADDLSNGCFHSGPVDGCYGCRVSELSLQAAHIKRLREMIVNLDGSAVLLAHDEHWFGSNAQPLPEASVCALCMGQGCEEGCGNCELSPTTHGPDAHKVCVRCGGTGQAPGPWPEPLTGTANPCSDR